MFYQIVLRLHLISVILFFWSSIFWYDKWRKRKEGMSQVPKDSRWLLTHLHTRKNARCSFASFILSSCKCTHSISIVRRQKKYFSTLFFQMQMKRKKEKKIICRRSILFFPVERRKNIYYIDLKYSLFFFSFFSFKV